MTWSKWRPYLLVSPLIAVLFVFVVVPLGFVVAVSFFRYDNFAVIPAFSFENYASVLGTNLTYRLYYTMIGFSIATWFFTLIIGFTIAYFLVFHVRNQVIAVGLFLVCTVPFWTSNIIRMIAWLPMLGKQGLINSALMATGVVDKPVGFLLFSNFAVVVSYVNLFTIFMIVPIFNSMSRIDRAAVRSGGRRRHQPLADAALCRGAAVQERHRARLDLRRHAGDGRLLRRQGDERRQQRLGGLGHV